MPVLLGPSHGTSHLRVLVSAETYWHYSEAPVSPRGDSKNYKKGNIDASVHHVLPATPVHSTALLETILKSFVRPAGTLPVRRWSSSHGNPRRYRICPGR